MLMSRSANNINWKLLIIRRNYRKNKKKLIKRNIKFKNCKINLVLRKNLLKTFKMKQFRVHL